MIHRTYTVLAALAAFTPAQTWHQVHPASAPSARQGHSMAFDSGRRCTVLFGGYEWTSDRHFQDHWEFDGTTWTKRPVAGAPSPRTRAGMCYDERRGVMVLFGGMDRGPLFGSPTYFGDTWEFDGTSWKKITPAGGAPSARIAELEYDPVRGVVVLFGGYGTGTGGFLTDTWEYDGTSWTKRTPSTVPTARPDYTLAFDRRRGKLVAHPGYILGHATPLRTWEWDGNDWSLVANPTMPPAFSRQAMAYDRDREVVVMVGGTPLAPQETWEFDGTDWRLNATAVSPTLGISGLGLAYDAARGSLVLFGGEVEQGAFLVSSDETWELATFARYETYGKGCAAGGGPVSLAARAGTVPSSGTTLVVDVSGLPAGSMPVMLAGASSTSWHGTPLPFDLGVIGLPRCDLLTSADVVLVLANQGGMATWSLPVPADPGLHGTRFYNQAFVTDAALQPLAVSNGGAALIGR